MVCRKTDTQNAEEAKKRWTDGRKYTLTLVQPSGEQLSLIAGYIEEVGCYCLQMHPQHTCVTRRKASLHWDNGHAKGVWLTREEARFAADGSPTSLLLEPTWKTLRRSGGSVSRDSGSDREEG